MWRKREEDIENFQASIQLLLLEEGKTLELYLEVENVHSPPQEIDWEPLKDKDETNTFLNNNMEFMRVYEKINYSSRHLSLEAVPPGLSHVSSFVWKVFH